MEYEEKYDQKIRQKVNDLLQRFNGYSQEQLYKNLCKFETKNEPHQELYQSILQDFFKGHFFYGLSPGSYLCYNENHYKPVREDELLYTVLQHLQQYNLPTEVKYRLKYKIQQKIRETPISKTIPHTHTIQNILSFLSPNLFHDKNYAKYFLITLGDILLKKSFRFYFLDPSMKPLIRQLQQLVERYFQNIQLGNFYKYKYQQHAIDISRVIRTHPFNLEFVAHRDQLFLDMICLAYHYSVRYESGDAFLDQALNEPIQDQVLWIGRNTKEMTLEAFSRDYLCVKEGVDIHEKDMLFLWKVYRKEKRVIHLFRNKRDILDTLAKQFVYQEPYFKQVYSMFLPHVEKFNQFWKDYMVEDPTEKYLEVTEVLQLFMEQTRTKTGLNEKTLSYVLQHYYPTLEWSENKYIHHWKCIVWDKKKDIYPFLQKEGMDVHAKYEEYIKHFKKRPVNKNYFLYHAS